ncbi:MAG: hypothetical protein EBV03_05200 [Proteobacteria bacterium]|nr:hypothetical protein [Pseudomonadota bacterium]
MKQALLAAAVSAVLFLAVFGVGLGFGFMFLPTLPLFFTGFSHGPRAVRRAVLVAALPIWLLMGAAGGTVYLLLLALPALYICQEALRPGHEPGQWQKLGTIWLHLTLAACVLVAAITGYYWGQEGGLPGLLATTIRSAFEGLEDEYGELIERAAVQWSFLIFPVTIWLWGMLLFAHGWLAHRWVRKRGMPLRPEFSIGEFFIPAWMLQLLAICALATLIGSESMRFLGKACLLSLMLPYFFAGAATLRRVSATWPNGGFFMFFIYFMVFTQLWPALILSMVGLWRQIKDLSGAKTSFRK